MIDPAVLLADLKKQVASLENDLRERASDVTKFDTALRSEWQAARTAQRTAAPYESWLEGQVTQSAVAWVLGTVFLRFCEDNLLIDLPWLAGPGQRLDIAKERQTDFFEDPSNRELTDREWIVDGFQAMSKASPVAAGLFDAAHNPMWQITPSLEASKALIAFWRSVGEAAVTEHNENGLVHNFTDPTWNTRFLGDLYQHLSEHAKKTYALLQTPEFVEEFILDLTLDPAIDEFGLDPEPPTASPAELNPPRGLRLIDPTCGSGHFLLGAFHRLLNKWEQQAPGVDRWELINRVLYSVHGVDKNPFAVSIARFRLFLAALRAGGTKRLADAPDFVINIAIGDSLLHGRGAPQLDQGKMEISADGELLDDEPFTYSTEDISDYRKTVDLLGIGSYHVVVGNPPYITVKDKRENDNYRVYKSCSGSYALTVPFAERFFQLAIRGGQDKSGSGHVGQITANSFMKREFGKKLIQEFFPTIELTHVIDTSGAYIPGHGTPTVILVGRRTWPRGHVKIRSALGVRGEPSQPAYPPRGKVWRAIVDQITRPGASESDWLSVTSLDRDHFRSHPWSLSGGGAAELLDGIEAQSARLSERIDVIGRTTHTGQDEAFYVTRAGLRTRQLDSSSVPVVLGEDVRDYSLEAPTWTLFPYDSFGRPREVTSKEQHFYWPNRAILRMRIDFGQRPEERGLRWFDHNMFFPSRYTARFSIPFAFVATHNHFVLDRGGKVFNRSAPVIKLPEETSEEDHLALLGVLNSSTACFWLKQVSQPKGGSGIGRGVQDEAWENRYEFTGTKLEDFPIPSGLPLNFGQELDGLAQRLTVVEPSAVCAERVPARHGLDGAHYEHTLLRGRMIALQEELDWEVYRLYGLLTAQEAAELSFNSESVPVLNLGERAFEIVLARKMARGEFETQWFARHGSTPIIEIPAHWPEAYKRVVEKRIEVIESRPDIALIERPDCKRRWSSESWEKKEKAALRNWLLDRCESRQLWFAPDDTGNVQPKPMTIGRLADQLKDDADFVSVARLYADKDAELATVLTEILDAEHVPYLAAFRYNDSGLRNRAQWEKTWESQREEDATGKRLDIPVPPKYKGADFLKQSYWSNRGKLDVPKERFISYPRASPDGDGSLLLGWAGWDHREQAHALTSLIEERTIRDGWEKKRLTPLIAGLDEVLPWVKQWHAEIDDALGMSPADAYASYLEQQQLKHGLTSEALKAWRPEKKINRARKRKPPE